MTTFTDLFHRHIAASVDKQATLNEMRQRWADYSFDTQRGKLILSKNPTAPDMMFDIQVLGAELSDDLWQWVWANPANIPARIIETSMQMRDFGQQEKIPEFASAQVQLQRSGFLSGATLAAVTCCMHNAMAYFPVPVNNANLFVLLTTQLPQKYHENPITRMANIFPQLASGPWAVPDFKRAFEGYAAYYSLEFMREGDHVVASHPQYGVITATFNDYNRLVNIEAKPVENKPSTGLASKFLKKG
jgi:hypothetical protein